MQTIQKGENMMRKILLVSIALVVISLLIFPVSGSKPAAKEKQESFTMYFFADMSRIFGFVNVPRLLGIQDTIYWVNKYKGGVQGRKMKVEWADHTNDLSVGATIYERWRTKKNFMYLAVCGSQENEAFHDRYAEDEVVVSRLWSPVVGPARRESTRQAIPLPPFPCIRTSLPILLIISPTHGTKKKRADHPGWRS
jgi:hypothetical protein